jgi:hypothetical protein
VPDCNRYACCLPSLLLGCTLHCVDCCAGDQLSVLLRLPALRSLSLVDGAIRDESLAHVGRCTKLTGLELQVSIGAKKPDCVSGVRVPCVGSSECCLSGTPESHTAQSLRSTKLVCYIATARSRTSCAQLHMRQHYCHSAVASCYYSCRVVIDYVSSACHTLSHSTSCQPSDAACNLVRAAWDSLSQQPATHYTS